MVLAHSAGDTECQSLNHEHSLYLPLRKTPEDTFRNTGKRPTQGRGVGYEKKNHGSHFLSSELTIHTFSHKYINIGLYLSQPHQPSARPIPTYNLVKIRIHATPHTTFSIRFFGPSAKVAKCGASRFPHTKKH